MKQDPRQAALCPKEVLHAGRFIRLVRQGTWEYVERIGSTGIVGLVPLTDSGELVLVEQFRVPCGAPVIELPAGLVGDLKGYSQESLESAAARELEEETGFRAAHLEMLTEGPNSSGSSASRMTLFLATELEKTGPGGGDEDEDITVHVVPVAGIGAWLKARQGEGRLLDPKIYAGLWFLGQRP
ncbi:MAG: NUDIX hydrolase [bacterium]